jgi:hypothetical protein
MKLFLSLSSSLLFLGGVECFSSFLGQRPSLAAVPKSSSTLRMISTGDDQSEVYSLDISKTVYTSTMKAPKDAFRAFAERGASNAKMSKRKILHQSILGGSYVGFGGLLSLCIAGNLGGFAATNPGVVKMAFAALFPVNLLLIVTTGANYNADNVHVVH